MKKIEEHSNKYYYNLKLNWGLTVLILLIFFNLWGCYQLCVRNLWVRTIKVKSLQSLTVNRIEAQDYYQKKIINQSWARDKNPMNQYIGALQWTMNQVRKVGYNSQGDNAVTLLKSVESGGGALCGDMADLYRNVLAAIGKPSRKVWLYRDLFGWDSHATVEVFLNDKWTLICPTFGVSFTNSEGRMLSAQDLKMALFTGKEQDIKPVFYGEVSYPARIEKYYLNYLLLCNNVFVVEKDSNLLKQIPPFCFWFGTKLYYEKLPNEAEAQITFLQQLYFIFAVIIPGLILFFISYLGYLITFKKTED